MTDGEIEDDGGENTDEIEDVNKAESKGLNCRCAHSYPHLSQEMPHLQIAGYVTLLDAYAFD